MTPSDFAAFTGAYHKFISNMRVLREQSSNSYTVVIKFTSQSSADSFYSEFNGKLFSSMESESCIVLYVSSVEFLKPNDKLVMFPPTEQSELPTCPVCLERLDDSVSGILTILCNHSFHCSCLSKWKGDNSCPVCRYTQQPEGSSPTCSICKTNDSLWICLICGNIGCGRYVNEHAREHYKETMHAYALELQTSRVWDYIGDGYVHRLVQNKSDGKLVHIPQSNNNININNNNNTSRTESEPVPSDGKLESISLEYFYLLDAQKSYFEEQLRRIEHDKFKKIGHLEEEYAFILSCKEQQDKRIKELEDEKRRNDKKVPLLEKKYKETLEEITFLKDINNALKQNQEEWKLKIQEIEKQLKEDAEKKINDLQDQIKDLMFFIEAKDKVANSGELQQGQLLLVPNNNNNTTTTTTSTSTPSTPPVKKIKKKIQKTPN